MSADHNYRARDGNRKAQYPGAMKRVMIIGQPGSGKSTLARRMGDATGLPVYHIDLIHWQSGWVERSGPEKDRMCAKVHARDAWIFEGREVIDLA